MMCKFMVLSIAEVVKLVDTIDSKSIIIRNVSVRARPSVHNPLILGDYSLTNNLGDLLLSLNSCASNSSFSDFKELIFSIIDRTV